MNIKKIFKNYYFLLTPVLLFFSYPSYDIIILKAFPLFTWFALIPVYIYIREKSLKQVYVISFITGLISFIFTNGWMGAFGASVPGGFLVILLFLMPALAFFFAAKIFIAEYISRRHEKFRIIIYITVWLFIDYIKSIGLLAFPWNYLGYTQYPVTPLLQIVSYTGVHGITFLIITCNLLISDLMFKYIKSQLVKVKTFSQIVLNYKVHFAFVLLMIFIFIHGFYIMNSYPKPKKQDLKVSLVQSCISPWDNWIKNRSRFLDDLEKLTNKALKDNPDFIIWSESATLEPISFDYRRNRIDKFQKRVLNLAKENNKPLLTGEIGVIVDYKQKRVFPQNSAVLIDENGQVNKSYAKMHLCPFGEWIPYDKWLPGVKNLVLEMGGSTFVPGNKPEIFEVNNHKFGVLICYEGLFYRLNRQYKNLGAKFFVNITNDGWSDYYKGHMQHFAAAKFRAIENGIWFVRAGNTGYTTLINPYGVIEKSIPILEKGYLTGSLDFSLNHDTFYSKFGDIFLYSIIAILIIMLTYFEFMSYYNKRKTK